MLVRNSSSTLFHLFASLCQLATTFNAWFHSCKTSVPNIRLKRDANLSLITTSQPFLRARRSTSLAAQNTPMYALQHGHLRPMLLPPRTAVAKGNSAVRLARGTFGLLYVSEAFMPSRYSVFALQHVTIRQDDWTLPSEAFTSIKPSENSIFFW